MKKPLTRLAQSRLEEKNKKNMRFLVIVAIISGIISTIGAFVVVAILIMK